MVAARSSNLWRKAGCGSIALLVAGVMGAALAVESAPDPVVERGLKHTDKGRMVVEAAIASTDLLLGDKGIRLTPSWGNREASAPAGVISVPVYLVAAPPKAQTTPAAVPSGCMCVFVNPAALDKWVAKQSTGAGRLQIDTKRLLTFMLLHEVGHLSHKTAGAEFANGELSELNIEPSRAKASEEEADEFAADLLRTLSQQKPVSSVSLEATWVTLVLSDLSWNMQAQRSLDEFGATAVGEPSVFFDQNLTHPNLEWRVLRANYLIQQTPATKELLDAFEAARRKGSNPQPLYVRPQK